MEVTLLNTNHMPNGWLAGQLTGFWKDLARDSRWAHRQHSLRPTADIVEDTDSYQFSFEMAGLKKDSVDVRVEDGHLIIEAERVRPELPKEAQVHLSERTYGPMRRTFKMPEDALTDGIARELSRRNSGSPGAQEAGDQAAANQGERRLTAVIAIPPPNCVVDEDAGIVSSMVPASSHMQRSRCIWPARCA